jgi:RNA-binding protein 25
MDEMHALGEEQRKAGMLLDDGAPVRLNVSLALAPIAKTENTAKEKTLVTGADEGAEEGVRNRKAYRPRRKPCSRARSFGMVSPM